MDGIIIVNKEAGMTSHDVVFKLRKILQTKKIGHTGTLDPNATGVLIVLIGKATKILPFIEDVDKEYVAQLQLGTRTLSDDIWDEVLEEKAVTPIEGFQAVLDTFKGKIKQVPPRISSIKINGRKLYEYTRNGEFVELPIRDVEIFDIEALEKDLMFRVHCSSGTYVRSLCVDIAAKTNNLGCMSSLVRTKVGKFSLQQASTLKEIEEGKFTVFSIEDMLAHMESYDYMPIEEIYHGKKIQLPCIASKVVVTNDKKCIAVYERLNGNTFQSVRGLW